VTHTSKQNIGQTRAAYWEPRRLPRLVPSEPNVGLGQTRNLLHEFQPPWSRPAMESRRHDSAVPAGAPGSSRRTVAPSSVSAPTLQRTSGIRLLSASPDRHVGRGETSLTPPDHLAARGAVLRLWKPRAVAPCRCVPGDEHGHPAVAVGEVTPLPTSPAGRPRSGGIPGVPCGQLGVRAPLLRPPPRRRYLLLGASPGLVCHQGSCGIRARARVLIHEPGRELGVLTHSTTVLGEPTWRC
jgi:hypothetical protein